MPALPKDKLLQAQIEQQRQTIAALKRNVMSIPMRNVT